jgi:hypothetical protein
MSAAATWILLVAGCGSSGNIGKVSGRVTLQGQPVANALVVFDPVVPGGASYGRTDESGNYVLTYTPQIKGAEIGEHTVRITSGWPANPDTGAKEIPERIPAKYNTQTELKREVKKGSNTIDFDF